MYDAVFLYGLDTSENTKNDNLNRRTVKRKWKSVYDDDDDHIWYNKDSNFEESYDEWDDEEDEEVFVSQYAKRSSDRRKQSKERQYDEETNFREEYRDMQKDVAKWFTDYDTSQYDDDKVDSFEMDGNPIGLILDKLFNVDTKERRRLADAYDYNMGIKKKGTTLYDDEDDLLPVDSFSVSSKEEGIGDNVIDVDATPASENNDKDESMSTMELEVKKMKFEMSWKERAEQVDRIPPVGIAAWGPNGEITEAKDAREAAVLNAQQEIGEAGELVDRVMEKVEDSRESMILLQA